MKSPFNWIGQKIEGIRNRLNPVDYREMLYQDLCQYLNGVRLARVFEIGPKDGKDTRWLLALEPETFTLIDLPGGERSNAVWLKQLASSRSTTYWAI